MVINLLSASARRYPLAVACASTTLKTTSADVIVQTFIERREKLDYKRTAAFTIFGCGWMGAGQYFVYCKLLEALLPARTVSAALGKMSLDQFIHVPFVFMPIFYLTDACVQGEGISYARQKYENEIVETMTANWQLWLPAQFIGFRFVPPHVRVPYVACVSFVWTMILSMLQGKFRAAADIERKSS
mmetsp:Transcript_53189/g.122217  ORF Transcript_53189/g.122217 Transcript_53189/m.122217 type:complete len:187 (-) Transcript_53189:179-739(-)